MTTTASLNPNLQEAIMTDLIAQIRAHALIHYEKDGWDIVVECWSDDDIVDTIGKAKTLTGAIKKIKAAVGPVHDYGEDIRATAF